MRKRTYILIIMLVIFFLLAMAIGWISNRQWNTNTLAVISETGAVVSLPEGICHLYVQGDNEDQVKRYIRSIDPMPRFESVQESGASVELSRMDSYMYTQTSDSIFVALGTMEIGRAGDYMVSGIQIPDAFRFVLIDSDKYLGSSVLCFGAGFLFMGGAAVCFILIIKDWSVFRWFIRTFSGISLHK